MYFENYSTKTGLALLTIGSGSFYFNPQVGSSLILAGTVLLIAALAIKIFKNIQQHSLSPYLDNILKERSYSPPKARQYNGDSLIKPSRPDIPPSPTIESLSRLLIEEDWEKIKAQTYQDPSNPNFRYINGPCESSPSEVEGFVFCKIREEIFRWIVSASKNMTYITLLKPDQIWSADLSEKRERVDEGKESAHLKYSTWYKFMDYSKSMEVFFRRFLDKRFKHPASRYYLIKQREMIKDKYSSQEINKGFILALEHRDHCLSFLLDPLVTEIPYKFVLECLYYNYENAIETCFQSPEFITSQEAGNLFISAITYEKWNLVQRFIDKGIFSNTGGDYSQYNHNLSCRHFRFKTILENAQAEFYYNLTMKSEHPINGKELENLKKLMLSLLNAGQSCDYIIPKGLFSHFFGYEPKCLLEMIYASQRLSYSNKAQLLSILLAKGAQVPKILLECLKRDLKNAELSLAKDLLDRGLIDQSQYDSYLAPKRLQDEEWTQESLFVCLIREQESVSYIRKRSNLAWDRVDFLQVSNWKQLKKEAKKFIHAYCGEAEQKEALVKVYNAFAEEYRALVKRHPILKLLRKVSKEIRKIRALKDGNKKLSLRLCKMISLWGNPAHTKIKPSHTHILNEKYLFKEIYQRIGVVAQRYFQDPIWYACNNLWVHGTKSSTLVMLTKAKEKKLWSTGSLLKQGITPLCGEICGSHQDINRDRISGEIMTPTFEDDRFHYMDAGTHLLVSLLYASKTHFYQDMSFSPEEMWRRIESVMRGDPENHFPRLPIYILRLRLTDPEANIENKLNPIYKFLRSKSQSQDDVQSALKSLTIELPFSFDPKDLEEISQPYPILFGCPDQEKSQLTKVGSVGIEYLNRDGLELGREISMAFTDPSHVAELKQSLQGEGVRVEEFDMALLLETMEMMRGSATARRSIQYFDMQTAQHQINALLQKDILPYYAALLSKEPIYQDSDGRRKKIPSPPFYGRQALTYERYIEMVNIEGHLARDIHGPMHATRVTLLTVMQFALFGVQGFNPILAAASGAFHDSCRQDEGRDWYEATSALHLKAFLQRYGLNENEIETYVRSVRDKDPKDDIYVDKVQMMVHNSDCWDIMRCLGDGHFDQNKLQFGDTMVIVEYLNQIGKKMSPFEYVKQLSCEIKAFIEQTENPTIKQTLEYESYNMYLDLLKLFKETHQQNQCYPFMHALLEEPLKALS